MTRRHVGGPPAAGSATRVQTEAPDPAQDAASASVVLLFTGGLKSTVALAMAATMFERVICLRIDDDHTSDLEADRALAVASWYGAELVTLPAHPDVERPGDRTTGSTARGDEQRLAVATQFAVERGIDLVWVATSSHDPAGRPEGAPVATGHPGSSAMRVGTPLHPLTREAITDAGLNLGAPVHLTSGCPVNDRHPCGVCGPCLDRRQAYRLAAGAQWPGSTSLDEEPPATTIYLAGLPHSGSTLLSVWLGSHPELTAAGELMSLRSSIDLRTPCTCGMPLVMCEFWAPIVHQDPVPVLSRVESLRELPIGAEAYRAEAERMLGRVAARAGTTLVLDSSKHLGRLDLLRNTPGIRVIHLVRDGRAYLDSVRRADQPGLDVDVAARQWVSQHAWAAAIGAGLGERYLVVRYEDLCTEGDTTIHRILDWLGLDRDGLAPDWTEVDSHHVHGNPLRFDRSPIRLDESWQRRLPSTDIARFSALAHATLADYGYSVTSSPSSGTTTSAGGVPRERAAE